MTHEDPRETEVFELVWARFYSPSEVRRIAERAELDPAALLQEDGTGAFGSNIERALRDRGYRASCITAAEERERDRSYAPRDER